METEVFGGLDCGSDFASLSLQFVDLVHVLKAPSHVCIVRTSVDCRFNVDHLCSFVLFVPYGATRAVLILPSVDFVLNTLPVADCIKTQLRKVITKTRLLKFYRRSRNFSS